MVTCRSLFLLIITTTTTESMSRLARPHWIDPTTNIIYDTNTADFEGWLTKQSMWLKVRLTLVLPFFESTHNGFFCPSCLP